METNGAQKSTVLWMGLATTAAGGLTALISLVILNQPVTEENLWTLYAIPYLIVGCCVFVVGIGVIILHLPVKTPGEIALALSAVLTIQDGLFASPRLQEIRSDKELDCASLAWPHFRPYNSSPRQENI